MNIDQQPVRARFGETNILNTFLTPCNPDIQSIYSNLTAGLNSVRERVAALWAWVANIPYTPHVAVRLSAGKKSIYQNDFWAFPAETVQLGIGNCFNKSTLLCSLLMNDSSIRSKVILGNLNSDGIGGHAWSLADIEGKSYYLEATQPKLQNPFIDPSKASIYAPVMSFNESGTEYLGGQLLEPLGLCCVKWLEDYLSNCYCTEYI